jgi:hypothetical protein
VDGVPEYRGISFCVIISTSIASGGTASCEAARAKNKANARMPTWPMAEITTPWRIKRFVAIINDCA